MSRHRDVRNLDYDEEYDEAYSDSVYGHSVDDHEYGLSPSVEQYMYSQRGEGYGFGAYLNDNENIKEEDGDSEECQAFDEEKKRRDSSNFERPRLSSEDEIKVNSVLDEIRNVVGEQFSEAELVRTIIANDFNFEKSLDVILNQAHRVSSSDALGASSRTRGKPHIGGKPSTSGVLSSDKSAPVQKLPPKLPARKFVLQQNGVAEASQGKDSPFEEPEIPIPVAVERTEKETPVPAKAPAKLRDKEVDVEGKYIEHRGSGKGLLNLVVVGHVDAGKSTLMGHLLYLQGIVTQRTLHKYEQQSKKMGKQSFMYAWVLDETEEERSRGITVDIAQRMFETKTKTITLLDAPGHRDFIPNMITGAARADVAVLVVDASKGGFEAGFESGGQTREHAILVRSIGLSQLAVAVNKLDTVDWSQARFDEVSRSLRQFLKTVGFRESDVIYIPCSGLSGDNLIERSSETLLNWYSGPTLLDVIDKLKAPEREINRPIRFCISDLYKGQGSSMCVAGRLETGYVQNSDRLMLMPQNELLSVKAIQAENTEAGFAFAGDHVTITVSGVDPSVLHVGDFLCDPLHPIPQATKIQARIVVFNIFVPLIKGSQLDFHYQSVVEAARIRKLISQLHKSTGQVIKQRPRALVKNTSAMLELEFTRPLCLEVFKNYKELGRFMLRNNGETVAAGMVTQILG